MSAKTRAVIFDLDGTLIDSLPDLAEALNAVLAEHGRDPLARPEVSRMVGDGVMTLVERGFDARGGMPGSLPKEKLVRRFLDLYEPRASLLTRPFPGVADMLETLRDQGYVLAVCTNKPSVSARSILKDLALEGFFSSVVGGDDTPALKPDPVHLTTVLDQLRVERGQAVMVGDSINDILVAKAAGVTSVAVTFGYARVPADQLGADAVISSYDRLPALISAL